MVPNRTRGYYSEHEQHDVRDGHGDCHYHYQSHSHGQGLSLNVSGILYSTFKMTLADSLTKDW